MDIRLNAGNANIVYEASDLEHGIGLILFEKDGEFQLHIWNEDDYNTALVMDLTRTDLQLLVQSVWPAVVDDSVDDQ